MVSIFYFMSDQNSLPTSDYFVSFYKGRRVVVLLLLTSIIITKELIKMTLIQSDCYRDTVQTRYQLRVGKWFQEKCLFNPNQAYIGEENETAVL